MMLDPLLIVELGILGLGTGFLAGLLGIGGGMLLVPFLTYILGHQQVAPDLAVKMAIATSMATIMFTSISSVRAHHKRGAVRWDIVKRLAPGIVIGGLVASLGVFSLLKGAFLAIFFGLFVSFSAFQMFLDKKPAPSRQMPGPGGQLAAGGLIGFLSGLVGAGGGFVSVPFMTWCNVAFTMPSPPVPHWAFRLPWRMWWVMRWAVNPWTACPQPRSAISGYRLWQSSPPAAS